MINKAMEHLGKERSAIRELFEQGMILKEKYGKDSVFDFSIGNPSIPCPDVVNESLTSLISNKNSIELHGYTKAQGDKSVRDAISAYLNRKYNANTSSDLIYMTVGAAAGLTISLKGLTDGNGNDEVIVFVPFFPEYSVFINNANAKKVSVNADTLTFEPDLNDFKNKITKNTSIVIINSPNNPTGVLYNEETIKRICEILQDKEKEFRHPIYLLSDEPYRELIYTDTKYPFITNYYNNSIITYSFSKSISLPGERIGYILVNPKCENANDVYAAICGAGRSLGYVCAPSLFQFLIPKVLGHTADISIYSRNAKLFYDELTKIGYNVIKPDGAFYLFMKALDEDDEAFSKKALEYNLLLVPSTSFGLKGYARIAYCVNESQIISSISKFKELYNSYI